MTKPEYEELVQQLLNRVADLLSAAGDFRTEVMALESRIESLPEWDDIETEVKYDE